jgi:hypothetical protein
MKIKVNIYFFSSNSSQIPKLGAKRAQLSKESKGKQKNCLKPKHPPI